MTEGMLIPDRPDEPLYIMVALICLGRVALALDRSEKEYEKLEARNETPRRLYSAMSWG